MPLLIDPDQPHHLLLPTERAEADRLELRHAQALARLRAQQDKPAAQPRHRFPERVTWACLGGFVFVSLCSGWGFHEGFAPTLVAAWLLAWVVRKGVRE